MYIYIYMDVSENKKWVLVIVVHIVATYLLTYIVDYELRNR